MVGIRLRYCAGMIWSVSILSRTTYAGPLKTLCMQRNVHGNRRGLKERFLTVAADVTRLFGVHPIAIRCQMRSNGRRPEHPKGWTPNSLSILEAAYCFAASTGLKLVAFSLPEASM